MHHAGSQGTPLPAPWAREQRSLIAAAARAALLSATSSSFKKPWPILVVFSLGQLVSSGAPFSTRQCLRQRETEAIANMSRSSWRVTMQGSDLVPNSLLGWSVFRTASCVRGLTNRVFSELVEAAPPQLFHSSFQNQGLGRSSEKDGSTFASGRECGWRGEDVLRFLVSA